MTTLASWSILLGLTLGAAMLAVALSQLAKGRGKR